ncbi:MAG: type II methionyl aminopeptidase [Candidatus Diapherotrites archaeon]|nr:type II methionyl aminopeptidase [Candidatus Diapherotrites archaeon]
MKNIEKYKKAGNITAEALKHGAKKIKVGAKLLDVAEAVEKYIYDAGAKPAFPCNISINEQAAHFTPGIDDEITFGEDVVKLDCGAHVDGFIGDAAITVDLTGEHGKLLEASERALEEAIAMVKPGVKSNEVGAKIEETIRQYGFKPIRNLTGHVLDEYVLHVGLTIPNIKTPSGFEIKEGMAIAIEPFATMGDGIVKEQRRVEIFSIVELKPVRNQDARKILKFAMEEYKALPFAERWLTKVSSGFKLKVALRELVQRGIFETYPVLVDRGLVSQKEYTIIVTEDGCEVTT